MRLRFDKHPVLLLSCILWSIFAFLFVLVNINNVLRVVLGIPVILFIPGYLLISVLFSGRKTEKTLDSVEKIALSLGISITIVPLFGIVLNYTPWGIRLEPLILCLGAFIFIMASIAIIRWYKTPIEQRIIFDVNLVLPQEKTYSDRVLTVILITCIIIAAGLLVYAILIPRQGERFTSFYVLASDHQAYNYPLNLSVGENTTVILGVVNHEQMTMNYSIEVWLSNQTTMFNTSSNRNETIYHNLWFLDKISIKLPYQPINLVDMVTSQWEYNYTFNITQKGTYKLVFLLYTTEVYQYSKNQDYQFIALEKVDNDQTTAYRNLYLWITVE